MTFQATDPIRKKIILENKPTEQILYYNYRGCDISYDCAKDT